MKSLYDKIILSAVVLLIVCSVVFGWREYIVERDTILGVFENETIAAAVSVDAMFAEMTSVFEEEVPQMEAFLAERERTSDEITEYLQQRTRWLSTTKNAMYIDLFCSHRGKYLCGNYWYPPKYFDCTKRPWYLAAMKADGKIATIPPYKPKDYPFQLVAISRKLECPDTVLSMDVQLSSLEPVVNKTLGGKNGYLFYFAPNGKPITTVQSSVGIENTLSLIYAEAKEIKDNRPFLYGEKYVFHSDSRNGWSVLSLHDRNDVMKTARWAILNPMPWLLLAFFIVFLLVEWLKYRADFARRTADVVLDRGNRVQFAVFLLALAVFFWLVLFGQHQLLQFESRLAVGEAETAIAEAMRPVVAFFETARGAAEHCSRHIARLLRSGADVSEIEAETKELISIYRSMPNRNYRGIFVMQPNWYVDSMGWKPTADFIPGEQKFYLSAIQNPTDIIVSPPYTSVVDGSEVVTFTRAVGDDEGTVVGIDIPLKMLQALSKDIRLQGAQCALLISLDGFIVDHRHFGSLSQEDRFDSEYIISRALQEGGSFQFEDSTGNKLQAVSVPVSSRGRAIVIGDERMLKSAVSSFRGRTMTAVVVVFLVMLFICVLLLRRIRIQRERDIIAEERTRQADQLQAALAMAQSANHAKTTFLNSMSHDIRTPMNAIIGFAGLAASHIDNKEQVKDYLGKIGQASNHLLSLINDVLDMSRIESGRMNLDEKPENLPDLIHTLHDIVMTDIHNKQHDFFIDSVNVNDENIICDKLRLNQVLLNILSNAIKYTAQGGTISMRITELTVKPNGYATYEFRIKDNGMGMDKEYLKTIFEPFTRAKSSTVSGIQGTGLGMAITKNIVDMMGGKIDVQSELGKGTQMTITFDFKLQEAHKESIAIEELKGLRALVADDDANTCVSITRMLTEIGMRSEWCTTGKEAVFRAQTAYHDGNSFKVYILDWLMPDMNGIETTRRIRKVIGDDVPIIILTAYDWSDIEEEAREAGVTAFVSKPMFLSDLQRVLNHCLGKPDPSLANQGATVNFSGRKVLLVEDNELNREIATELLTGYGFAIDVADDGTVAVEKMKNAKDGDYDVVLMDIQMPVMNGYEATRKIRALGTLVSKVPILAMTADAFAEDRQKALDAGMNDHITKPIDIAKLTETLTKYLG